MVCIKDWIQREYHDLLIIRASLSWLYLYLILRAKLDYINAGSQPFNPQSSLYIRLSPQPRSELSQTPYIPLQLTYKIFHSNLYLPYLSIFVINRFLVLSRVFTLFWSSIVIAELTRAYCIWIYIEFLIASFTTTCLMFSQNSLFKISCLSFSKTLISLVLKCSLIFNTNKTVIEEVSYIKNQVFDYLRKILKEYLRFEIWGS